MATVLSTMGNLNSNSGARPGSHVQVFLRLEGLAAAALAAVFYQRTGASWWLFAALWLTPDLSMLGYLGGPKLGARIYNAIHSYVTPATLAVMAVLLKSPALLPYALIWINHIGVDRVLGYGLKYPDGFGWTHLGKLGGRRAQAIAAS
ncbi:MAG: DUF4260 domain-containing protein [Terracidiphilus sp.]